MFGIANYKLILAVPLLFILVLLTLRIGPVYPLTTGEGATLVIGQSDFTSGGSATTASGLDSPTDVAFDSSGNLWVVDNVNNRVLEYLKGNGFTTGESASLVIGQSGLGSGVSGVSADRLSRPHGITFDSSGNLWVADYANHRVLEFLKGSGFTTGESASLVIGQSDFTSNASRLTAAGMGAPESVVFDSSGNLWVADFTNSRVLEYLKGNGFTTGQSASLVLGQLDFTSGGRAHTASGLSGPLSVIFDTSGNLWVADRGNNRVLEYLKGNGFTTGESASLVIGQSNFISSGSATTDTNLYHPFDLAFDTSGNLWVADGDNRRVLEYLIGDGFVTGESASLVIGQSDFTSRVTETTAGGLSGAQSVTFDSSGNLWVSDYFNRRVLAYSGSLQGTTTTTSTSTSTTTATSTTVSVTTLTSVAVTTAQGSGTLDLSMVGIIAVASLVVGVAIGYFLRRRG